MSNPKPKSAVQLMFGHDGLPKCERCSGSFRVELCEVHRGPVPNSDRNRFEAYLCYSCRQDTTHKVIG